MPKAGSSSKSVAEHQDTDVIEDGSKAGWLVGEEMDTYTESVEVRWPFREGSTDWDGREYVL